MSPLIIFSNYLHHITLGIHLQLSGVQEVHGDDLVAIHTTTLWGRSVCLSSHCRRLWWVQAAEAESEREQLAQAHGRDRIRTRDMLLLSCVSQLRLLFITVALL